MNSNEAAALPRWRERAVAAEARLAELADVAEARVAELERELLGYRQTKTTGAQSEMSAELQRQAARIAEQRPIDADGAGRRDKKLAAEARAAELEGDLATLQVTLKQTADENERLRQRVEYLQRVDSEYESLVADLERCSTDLQATEARLAEAEARLEEAKRRKPSMNPLAWWRHLARKRDVATLWPVLLSALNTRAEAQPVFRVHMDRHSAYSDLTESEKRDFIDRLP